MSFGPENLAAEPSQIFDCQHIEGLIADYQRNESPELLGAIIKKCEPLALGLIRGRATMMFEAEDELLSSIYRKLLISVPQFDCLPSRAHPRLGRNRAQAAVFEFDRTSGETDVIVPEYQSKGELSSSFCSFCL